MFFIEYTEYDIKKVINIAMCHSIETHKDQRSSNRDVFSLKIEYSSNARNPSVTIDFKTEGQLDEVFEGLMDAIQNNETRYWKVPTYED